MNLINKYSDIIISVNNSERILLKKRKELIFKILKTIPATVVFLYLIIVSNINLSLRRDSLPIYIMISILFMGWGVFCVYCIVSYAYQYRACKKFTWSKSLLFIENTSKGKIYGIYRRNGEVYSGKINNCFAYSTNEFRTHFATILFCEESKKMMLISEYDWCKEAISLDRPITEIMCI